MNDPRAAIFMAPAEFEASLGHLSEQERKAAKVSHVRSGIELFWDEYHWKRSCKPSFGVLCLVPVFWPVLWYRGQMSKMAASVIAQAIHACRDAWPGDLADANLDFGGIPEQ